MSDKGIDTVVYYPVPVHQLPIYKNMKWDLPLAEKAAEEVLSLPIWPQIQENVQEQVAHSLLEILKSV